MIRQTDYFFSCSGIFGSYILKMHGAAAKVTATTGKHAADIFTILFTHKDTLLFFMAITSI